MAHGGSNRVSLEDHRLRNTFRPHRHGGATPPPSAPLSSAARRAALDGLEPPARRLARQLLDEYGNWDPASLETLRSYARSCVRLEQLQAANEPTPTPALAREVRINMALLKSLQLEK